MALLTSIYAFFAALAALTCGTLFGAWYAWSTGPVSTGFLARDACNAIFVQRRTLAHFLEHDLIRYPEVLRLFSYEVDREGQTVSAFFLPPLASTTAVHRDGYGCTLIRGETAPVPPMPEVAQVALPAGDPARYGFDPDALSVAFDSVFAEPLPNHRALLLMVDGKVLGERYAPGFDAEIPKLSFSMHKSITGLMVAAAAQDGLLDVNAPIGLAVWSATDDPRRFLTWKHLLQAQGGFDWQEEYLTPSADVPQMNLVARGAGTFAAAKPLAYEPGTHFQYSTGTSNILQLALREVLENQGVDYHTYAQTEIFAPIGAASVVQNPDSTGTFIGGSYAYATARDWAKLGQLLLQDGVWGDQRILPRGWRNDAMQPASDSRGRYGYQVWLNKGRRPFFPGVPAGAFWFSGWQGQVVLGIPEWNMVFVHLGRTDPAVELQAVNEALEMLLASRSGS